MNLFTGQVSSWFPDAACRADLAWNLLSQSTALRERLKETSSLWRGATASKMPEMNYPVTRQLMEQCQIGFKKGIGAEDNRNPGVSIGFKNFIYNNFRGDVTGSFTILWVDSCEWNNVCFPMSNQSTIIIAHPPTPPTASAFLNVSCWEASGRSQETAFGVRNKWI